MVTVARKMLCDGLEAKMLGWLSSKKDAGLTARLFLCDGYSSKK